MPKEKPCRCGEIHESAYIYRNHQCFHTKLTVIDSTEDGDVVVYCGECETAWIAPVVAEGVSVTITSAANARGCEICRKGIMALIKDHPESIDHTCQECGERWVLTRDEAAARAD